jgi:hypothetical protein
MILSRQIRDHVERGTDRGGCADNATEPPRKSISIPAEVAGVYAISEVDGHPLGWYHHLAAVDCQAAFIDGQLDIGENGQYIIDLDYNFRCIGTDSFDGSDRFYAHGSIRYKEGEVFVLQGLGPNFVDPTGSGITGLSKCATER